MTSITSASSVPVLTQSFSSVSSSTIASSSRLPETPIKKETSETSLSDPNSSSKKRRISESNDDQEDDDDEDLGDSSFASASPSKPSNTGGRRKASDEERKARLEARQARNRLSAQYSRERKKAYVEQLEGSVNTLKAENTLLRSQRDQDQLIRQTLEAKLKDSQLRIDTLETIIRTVAPSLAPLLMSSSSSSSSSSSTVSSSAFAAPSTSAIASQLDTGLSADLASFLQNTGLTNKEVSLPLAIAAPASTASSLSLGTSSQQTSNEGFDGSAGTEVSAQAKVGSNVDVNGSSVVNQGYPLASQISVLAPEQPSTIAAGPRVTLSQHPIEAKAAGVAREAEALLSNFIDLDAKFANSDAAAAAKDQGASASSASSQTVSVGQGNAAAATAGALRSASASAGELASLGSGRGESGFSGSNSNEDMHSKFNTISLPNDMDDKDVDLQQRFQLLNSPLLPNEKNVWELATDAMLQDIYGKTSEDTSADYSAPSVSASDASTHTDASAGSSPFDLVDLDIEIEEPLHLNIGLDENETMDASNGYLHTTGHVGKADASPMDWPGLLASLVA
ncbi:uncharacterized protein UBRO2_00314 [Ustilago bromivora]|uniref:BZIP domain-containing protein n=1 Tax=Ustilago bromivora TaxID=307758 RepID=A0A8H8TN14_9BASI|nr:uncharacterized protein UBRO2_00314 [Ustilago bromivora]